MSERVPRLRFPGFEGEWKGKRVRDLVERVNDPVTVHSDETYREIGVRSHGRGVFHKDEVDGAELGDKRVFHVQPEALVLNIVFAWEQAVAMTSKEDEGFIASHRFPMYLARQGQADLRFLLRLFLRPRGKWLLELASPGGAGRNRTLGQEDFLDLAIPVPTEPEQCRIADALDAVDAKLDALSREREALAEWKRGLATRLFDRTLRFRRDDGTAFPDWEEKAFGEVFDWVRTNSLSREALADEPQAVRNIHYGDIHRRLPASLDPNEGLPFIRPAYLPEFQDNEFCQLGDVIIADASEDVADIGKAVEIVVEPQTPVVAGLHTILARPKPCELAVGFAAHLFASPLVRRSIQSIAQGISVLGISRRALGALKLALPHPDEQVEIAKGLTALDAKLNSLGWQIKEFERFKSGLLQRLFV